MIDKLNEHVAEPQFAVKVLCGAFTGAACTNLPNASTLHHIFNLRCFKNKTRGGVSEKDYDHDSSVLQKSSMRARFRSVRLVSNFFFCFCCAAWKAIHRIH